MRQSTYRPSSRMYKMRACKSFHLFDSGGLLLKGGIEIGAIHSTVRVELCVAITILLGSMALK